MRSARRLGLVMVVAAVAFASRAGGDDPRDGALFSITKSENKNFVQYVVRLDERCVPVGGAPVHAYWRMLEKGASSVEPLLSREQAAYGVASQSVLAKSGEGGAVRVLLRALPDEAIVVESRRGAGGCETRALVPIAGTGARLYNVHAVLRWPFGVSRLVVSGWALADGRVVREERRP